MKDMLNLGKLGSFNFYVIMPPYFQAGTNMGLSSSSGVIGPVTPQQMIGVQCPELQNTSQANAAASWR